MSFPLIYPYFIFAIPFFSISSEVSGTTTTKFIAYKQIATIGDATAFRNGREMAAFIGLVPKQNSSGGRQVLLGISKRAIDIYLDKKCHYLFFMNESKFLDKYAS
jgi:hypothetical protein